MTRDEITPAGSTIVGESERGKERPLYIRAAPARADGVKRVWLSMHIGPSGKAHDVIVALQSLRDALNAADHDG